MKDLRVYTLLFTLVMAAILPSCKVLNPSVMFKDAKDNTGKIVMDPLQEYTIKIDDKITVQVHPNEGYELVSKLPGESERNVNTERLVEYRVRKDGYVTLPIVDSVHVEGMTITQVEDRLKERYKVHLVNPFVKVEVTNRRVFVYTGGKSSGGGAEVVDIENENMTVLEAIASAGGIAASGKAFKIKLIRDHLSETPKVSILDLSTMAGLQQANLKVEANDIIYIEPAYSAAEAIQEVTPILGLITSVVLIYDIITRTR